MADGGVGRGRRVAGGEVEDTGSGNYGDAGDSNIVADTLLLEKSHDAVRRPETEGAAAGKQEGVCLLVSSYGVKEVCLAGTG